MSKMKDRLEEYYKTSTPEQTVAELEALGVELVDVVEQYPSVIFLDIDGVITSARTGWMNMDIYAVSFLRMVCQNSGVKIVISSTWRFNRDRQFFADIFGEDIIHDHWRTDVDLLNNGTHCRGDEIKIWLDLHPDVTNYIILDDDADFLPEQMDKLIHTKSLDGMLNDDMTKICDKLLIPVYNSNLMPIFQHPNMFLPGSLGSREAITHYKINFV